MSIRRIVGRVGKAPANLIPVLLIALFLVGCGSNSSAATSTTAAATATQCAQTRPRTTLKTASGKLKSISGTTLVITPLQGSDVTVTYSSTTRFTRQESIAASALKEGASVTVVVTSANNTYTATRISATTGTTGSQFPGQGTGANNPCFSLGRRSGTFGGGQFGGANGTGTGTGSSTGASNFRGLIGTVYGFSGNILTVTDSSGTTYTVTVTPQTQITQTNSVTAATLKTGMALIVSGTAGSQGTINARTVSIVPKVTAIQPRQTPTPTP